MQTLKKAIALLSALSLAVVLTANTASADYSYESSQTPPVFPLVAVDNSGTFGMSVDNFRDLCEVTDGEWDVVNGRHVCYCWSGEFSRYDGCEDYWDDDYDYDYDYDYNDDDYYYDDDDYYRPNRPDLRNPFWDLAGHPDEYYILKLYNMGILKGYPDGAFRPDQPVTRAEMVKMALEAAELEPLGGDEDRNRFFVDLDSWQAPWVNAAYRLDIVEGYSGYNSGVRLYKPNNWVNRAEGVKLVLSSFGRRPLDFDYSSFYDVTGWMVPWLEDAYRIGLIDRDFSGSFYPADPMTRGTAAKVIVKMLQYSGDI